VLFSEPSAKVKLSAAVIKELTGGDEQNTRAMYGRKQTFVMNGTVHVLCNKIPEVDDFDGGMSRRIRCIPYGSTFVDEEQRVDHEKHVYLKQNLDDNEAAWGKCLMWEVMRARSSHRPRPERPPSEEPGSGSPAEPTTPSTGPEGMQAIMRNAWIAWIA